MKEKLHTETLPNKLPAASANYPLPLDEARQKKIETHLKNEMYSCALQQIIRDAHFYKPRKPGGMGYLIPVEDGSKSLWARLGITIDN